MLILVGLYFGTRISETVRHTYSDFNGAYIRNRYVKGSNDRFLLIPDEFRGELWRHCGGTTSARTAPSATTPRCF